MASLALRATKPKRAWSADGVFNGQVVTKSLNENVCRSASTASLVRQLFNSAIIPCWLVAEIRTVCETEFNR